MSLPRFYNTLSRQTEEFTPRIPGKASIYNCGPTVYDLPHAGHARQAVAADLLVRRLRAKGLDVTYVRNVTDVDDKILGRAKELGESPTELSRRMAEIYFQQYAAVGCVTPEHQPRVSGNIPEIIALIQTLVERGAAYAAPRPNGTTDVYFAVRSFPDYGKLSRRRLDELLVGARVEQDELKRDPLDFALWKGALPDEWGWDSPWGHGRPGWHIECSAMSARYLGHGFDVHCGGMDLIFPHHENEIAQSEAAAPEAGPFARVWLHNGFLNVDKEKMSKSLGNFVTISDVLARNDPEAFRYYLLTAHYRAPIQFDTEKLSSGRVIFPAVDEAERRVDYLYATSERLVAAAARGRNEPAKLPAALLAFRDGGERARVEAEVALDDDLNTPVALAALGELARHGNELCDLADKRRKDAVFATGAAMIAAELNAAIRALCDNLGLLQAAPEQYAARTRQRRLALRGLEVSAVEAKVQDRATARQNKDFARADAIRQELLTLGIALCDTPTSTEWSVLA
jgi:cysteinyl-tRNA synthetase